MGIGSCATAQILDLTPNITFNLYPLIGIIAAIIGVGIDHHRASQEGS